jgi:hypothetical protein
MTRHWLVTTLALLAAGLPANAQPLRNLSSLPDSAFEHIYRHIRYLQTLDSASAAKGRATNLSAHYKNLAGLTQQQAVALQTVSLAAVTELDGLDRQAQDLILQSRAQGRTQLLPGQKPPAPPAGLATLQNARKAALFKYRNNLAEALGPAAFARLEQALIVSFKVGPQATTPNPGTGR